MYLGNRLHNWVGISWTCNWNKHHSNQRRSIRDISRVYQNMATFDVVYLWNDEQNVVIWENKLQKKLLPIITQIITYDNLETFGKFGDNSSTFAFVITSTLIWREKAFPPTWVSVNISRQCRRILASECILINRAPSWIQTRKRLGEAESTRSRSNSLIREQTEHACTAG